MDRSKFIFMSEVNSFHYLYQDAEHLRSIVVNEIQEPTFDLVRFSRSAILLYIFSLEALANRAMSAFLPERMRDFFLDRESNLSTLDKWQLLPLLALSDEESRFDISSYPWSHFAEMITLRNDYVHPKHNRPAYYKAKTSHSWTPLSWKEIPEDLGVNETTIVYRQTRIPRDPYAIRPEHLETVKTITDDMIRELDRLLDSALTKGDWLHADNFQLVYPPGTSLSDIPVDPKGKGPGLSSPSSSDVGF